MDKVWPLKNCSNCSSLKLQTHKKRSFQNPRAKQNFVFILPPLGFFVLVYGYLFVQGDLVLFLSIVTVYSVFFISVLFKITMKNINCKECNARNFPFVSNVSINLMKQNGTLIDGEDLTKRIAKTVLEGLKRTEKTQQKRHYDKNSWCSFLSSHCNTWNFLCKPRWYFVRGTYWYDKIFSINCRPSKSLLF